MARRCEGRQIIQGHPCFGGDHRQNGRIHLAVAPRCNITCGYCSRRHDCVNESRPGVASRVLTPRQALERVREVMASRNLGPLVRVVGIAGPGDPLANAETFEAFRLVGEEFPHLIKCLSTNGLLLPESVAELRALGVKSITVTVNALDPAVGGEIYQQVRWNGRLLRGAAGAEILIANQLAGIGKAVALGMVVKVNSVLIPGVNDEQLPRVAERVKELGALVMNIMPLIPQAAMAHRPPPPAEYLEEVRTKNERIIWQFRHCRQCRADAVGLIGREHP